MKEEIDRIKYNVGDSLKRNVTELKSFLGLLGLKGYFLNFIRDLNVIYAVVNAAIPVVKAF